MLRFKTVLLTAVLALAAPAAATKTDGSKPASNAILSAVTSVPASTLDAVGVAKLSRPENFPRKKLAGPALARDGKPELLTANLAWCPHCAANSWALAVALSRFGTFTSLRTIDVGTYFRDKLHARPGYAHAKGISFFNVAYASDLLSFAPVIVQDLKGRVFQSFDADQQAAFDAAADGGYPFVDGGGLYASIGSGYSPQFLGHRSARYIAGVLKNPNDPIARRVDSLANYFSAMICAMTNQQPGAVCTSAGVTAAQAQLPT